MGRPTWLLCFGIIAIAIASDSPSIEELFEHRAQGVLGSKSSCEADADTSDQTTLLQRSASANKENSATEADEAEEDVDVKGNSNKLKREIRNFANFVFWGADTNEDNKIDRDECMAFAQKHNCKRCIEALLPGRTSVDVCNVIDTEAKGEPAKLREFRRALLDLGADIPESSSLLSSLVSKGQNHRALLNSRTSTTLLDESMRDKKC